MTTKDGTITGTTTTPTITGQGRAEQEKILQLGMQYMLDLVPTFKNPKYLYSQVGQPELNPRFLRVPEQCWNLFYQVSADASLFPEVQAADMTTASLVIGIKIGKREGVYSVERHFLSVDKNNVFDTETSDSSIAQWHG